MGVHIEVTLSRPTLLRDMRRRYRDPSSLMHRIGTTGLSGMADRLRGTYSMDVEAYRTGRLEGSLRSGGKGNIFDLQRFRVTVGSGVRYAAKQDQGGLIRPRTVKALAIPIGRAMKVKTGGEISRWPRDFPRDALEFRPNLEGGKTIGWLFDANEGALGLGTGPLWALEPFVVLPAKRMAEAGKDRILLDLDTIYADWIKEAAA